MMSFSACIVDANVALQLVLKQELTDSASALFDRVVADDPLQMHVPDLFFAEITNVLTLQTRLGKPRLLAEQAYAALQYLRLLPFAVTGNHALGPRALELAMLHRLNGYDAIYVALAEKFDLPFITADNKLVNALKGYPGDIRWLGDVR